MQQFSSVSIKGEGERELTSHRRPAVETNRTVKRARLVYSVCLVLLRGQHPSRERGRRGEREKRFGIGTGRQRKLLVGVNINILYFSQASKLHTQIWEACAGLALDRRNLEGPRAQATALLNPARGSSSIPPSCPNDSRES